MNNAPAISIVMPVYNAEPWLRDCLDSILAQIFTDWECICVDDGSNDGSPAILDEYASKDSRFRVIRQKNEGPGPARNHALDLAKGRFVCFMDPDDKYPSNSALEKLFAAVSGSGCDVAGGVVTLVSDSGESMGHAKSFGTGVIPYRETQQQYNYQAYLFSRKLIEAEHIRFPNLRRRQDPPFFVAAMIAAGSCCYIPEPVYEYRLRTSRPKIDWTADGGLRLRDNVEGIALVADLAEKHGLDALFRDNARALFIANSPVFRTAAEVRLAMPRLRQLVVRFEKSGKIPRRSFLDWTAKLAKSEASPVSKFAAKIDVFGLQLMLLSMIRIAYNHLKRPFRGIKGGSSAVDGSSGQNSAVKYAVRE